MGGGDADHRGSRARPSVILRQDLSGVTLGRYEGHNNEKMLFAHDALLLLSRRFLDRGE